MASINIPSPISLSLTKLSSKRIWTRSRLIWKGSRISLVQQGPRMWRIISAKSLGIPIILLWLMRLRKRQAVPFRPTYAQLIPSCQCPLYILPDCLVEIFRSCEPCPASSRWGPCLGIEEEENNHKRTGITRKYAPVYPSHALNSSNSSQWRIERRIPTSLPPPLSCPWNALFPRCGSRSPVALSSARITSVLMHRRSYSCRNKRLHGRVQFVPRPPVMNHCKLTSKLREFATVT